ncbi:uncharacterized protein [Typha latifolia]|uniref:uncharacterized protein n=1 Tax=Typha latifolia TaxID=4733 RepID=UPI003C30C155
MATGWIRTLHCKSNALEDVVLPRTSPKKQPLLPLSCAKDDDVVLLLPKYPSAFPKKPSKTRQRRKKNPNPRPPAVPPSPAASPPTESFPTLAELPEGHSSRRVVEIIFSSSWSSAGRFPGEIEMLFRVHNPVRTVARFEEYRSAVRSRASRSGEPRCAADGNEMMRFHRAAGGNGAEQVYAAVVAPTAKEEGIRTFSRSGAAHESGCGGRNAMLVCRVIAGRVRAESDPESEGESVRVGKGELVVFDSRAVLPCFLIIYKAAQ